MAAHHFSLAVDAAERDTAVCCVACSPLGVCLIVLALKRGLTLWFGRQMLLSVNSRFPCRAAAVQLIKENSSVASRAWRWRTRAYTKVGLFVHFDQI